MSGTLEGTDKSTDVSLQCGMCKNTLQNPHILPCLHSMCYGCLQSMLDSNKSSDSFDCPTCQEGIPIPSNGVDGFPENVYLNGVIGVQTARSSKGKQCDICSLRKKNNLATHKCLNCGDILCQTCSTSHSSTRMTIDHNVTALDEIVKGTYDKTIRAMNKINCSTHETELLVNYCRDCNILACRECKLITHYNHNCITVEEAPERQGLMLSVEHLQTKASVLAEIESGIEDTLADLEVTEKDVLHEIETASQKLIDQIEQDKHHTIQKLKNHMTTQRQICEEQKRIVQDRETTIRESTDFCTNVLQSEKNDEVIYLEPTLSARLEYLDNLPDVRNDIVCQFPEVRIRNIFGTTDSNRFFDFLPGAPSSIPLLQNEDTGNLNVPRVAVLQLVRKINTFAKIDEFQPKLTALSVLSNDKIVVCDSENTGIKIFTSGGKYFDTVARYKANSIAVCGDTIAFTDNYSLNLFSSEFRRKVPLTGNASCHPICTYRDTNFLLADCPNNVFKIYEKCGDVVDTIPMPKLNHRTKRRKIMFVVATSKGEVIAVDWGTNSVLLVDEHGRMKNSYKSPLESSRDWFPGDVCVDIHDNVFVADQQKGIVLVLNPELKVMLKYSTKKDYLERPMNITYDSHGHILVSGKGGVVNVYNCKYM